MVLPVSQSHDCLARPPWKALLDEPPGSQTRAAVSLVAERMRDPEYVQRIADAAREHSSLSRTGWHPDRSASPADRRAWRSPARLLPPGIDCCFSLEKASLFFGEKN